MKWAVEKSPQFLTDFARQFQWYFEEAGENVAWRFQQALDQTILRLSENPTIGKPRHFKNPSLHGLRSFQVNAPFKRFLVFYRKTESRLEFARLMEGSRNLPQRLAEPE